MVTVCGKLSAVPWLWPLQEEFAAQRDGACRLPRKACQMRWSCARVGVEVSKAAGMMPEHSPVPPEACRGPRVDDQRRTVPMSRRGADRGFAFVPFCHYPKWKSPGSQSSTVVCTAVKTPCTGYLSKNTVMLYLSYGKKHCFSP